MGASRGWKPDLCSGLPIDCATEDAHQLCAMKPARMHDGAAGGPRDAADLHLTYGEREEQRARHRPVACFMARDTLHQHPRAHHDTANAPGRAAPSWNGVEQGRMPVPANGLLSSALPPTPPEPHHIRTRYCARAAPCCETREIGRAHV